MKTILCYGDSNTWGYVLDSFDLETLTCQRYPREIRWTGRLQKLLGEDYFVIEEGLCGRNTNIPNPPDLGGDACNGKTYLQPCLFSHAPIDLVVLMLGGNDFKADFKRSPQDVAAGLKELIQMIQNSTYGADMKSPPRILLLGYPYLSTRQGPFAELFAGADEKSQAYPALCKELAQQYGCDYLDMSTHISMSPIDGLHIDEQDQEKFATLVANKILDW